MKDAALRKGLERALEFGEVGVQVAAYIGDELIEDCIGIADPETGHPVDEGTLFPIFSVTKQIVATAVHVQVQRGLIDLDAPIAEYWPEFAAKGKDRVTVGHVMAHQSGVISFGSPLPATTPTAADWDEIIANLANVELAFPAGENSSYQALNHGYLLGEVIRRTDPSHRPLSTFVADEICAPLGISDLWFGVPPSRHDRVATLVSTFTNKGQSTELLSQAVPAVMDTTPEIRNRPAVWEAGWPSCGVIANASSVARFWAMLANGGELDGVRLLEEDRVWSFFEPRANTDQRDALMGFPFRMSTAGYYIAGPPWREEILLGADPNAHVLCGIGAGGTVAFANLDLRLSVSICHNRMFDAHPSLPEDRHPFAGIAEAIYRLAEDSR